jgi:Secretion system C-terminal sorting domain/Ig-like domain CHU_C associated
MMCTFSRLVSLCVLWGLAQGLVLAQPIVNLGRDTTLCGQSSYTLDAGNTGATFLWNTGATTQTLLVQTDGAYTVAVSDANGTSRDTVYINFQPFYTFSRPDTVLCSGQRAISVNGATNLSYQWYDAAVGGNLLFTGRTWAQNYTTSANYFISAGAILSGYTQPLTNTAQGSNYYLVNQPRGLYFDLAQPQFLYSVDIPTTYAATGTGTMTADINIYNSSNFRIFSKTGVALPAGVNTITLNASLPAGTGYYIMLENINHAGRGRLHVSVPFGAFTYPVVGTAATFTSGRFNGNPFATQWNYFYNFKFASEACRSPRIATQVTVNPAPIISIPKDTITCNLPAVVLNAGAPNYTYTWNAAANNSTTNTATITQSGLVIVQAQLGNCIERDSTNAYLNDTVVLQASNVSLCAGNILLNTQTDPSHYYFWWNAPNGGTALPVASSPLEAFITTTTTFYVEARSGFSFFEGAPNETFFNSTSSGYYSAPGDTRGLAFNILSPSVLASVVVYADGGINGILELQTSTGQLISSKNINLIAGANRVSTNFNLPVGAYRLVLRNLSGTGKIFIDAPDRTIYPLNYPHLRITGSILFNAPNTGQYSQQYYYFYNFELVETNCPTARYPYTVNVLPTALLTLPRDTVACAQTAILEAATAQHPLGTTYAWSTGANTSNISVSQSDTVSVIAQIGSCTTYDTIGVQLASPPTLLTATADTSVCNGQLTLRAQTNGYTLAWYDGATTNSPISLSDSLAVNVQSTDTFWVEGVNFLPRLNTYGSLVQTNPLPSYTTGQGLGLYPSRGIEFEVQSAIRLDQISMYADSAAVQARIRLIDANGIVLQTKNITLNSVGGENLVMLGWTILPNNALNSSYFLVLDSLTGGRLAFQSVSYPYSYPEFTIRRGYPIQFANVWNFMYKWRISVPGCATPRQAMRVGVLNAPNLSMPADTSICASPSPVLLTATASNPNFRYIWSTNETTNSISPNQSGYYSVTVTNNGICPAQKSVLLQFISSVSNPSLNDTSLCASSLVTLAPNNPNFYNWFNLNNQQVHIGGAYPTNVRNSTEFSVQNTPRASTRLGLQTVSNPNNLSLYPAYYVPNRFDVLAWSVLDSVAVYAKTAPASFDVVVRNSANQIIFTKNFTIQQARTKIFLPLNLALAPANNYQLEFANANTQFLANPLATFPTSSSSGVARLTGTPFSNQGLGYFMDWHFSYGFGGACANPTRDTMAVNVRLPLLLADTTVFACDSAVVNVGSPLASQYLWSTGATTAALTLRQTGTYTVTVSDGAACTGVDTFRLSLPLPVGLPTVGYVCSYRLANNYTNVAGSQFQWNTGSTASTITLPSAGIFSLTVTTPQGCVLADTCQIDSIPLIPFFDLGTNRLVCLGSTLSVILPSGLNYAWATGQSTQNILINNTGLYKVTVSNSNQCTGVDSVYLTLRPLPTANFALTYNQNNTVGLNNTSQNFTTYSYNYGDTVIATTAAFHLYDTAGCYRIVLTVSNPCGEDRDTIYAGVGGASCNGGVGVDENIANNQQSLSDFSIYPNPNQGDFNLHFFQPIATESTLGIYTSNGEQVWESILPAQTQDLPIALKDLPAGVYFVQITNNQHSSLQKLILFK